LPIVQDIIKKFVRNTTKELSIEYILESVAAYFNIPVDKVLGNSRKRQCVEARQLTMYLSKQMTPQSLKSIGQFFGGKDHSTVIYSCRTIADMMHIDAEFKDTVDAIEKKIRMGVHA
jgi:chromosomal replication initiator protein